MHRKGNHEQDEGTGSWEEMFTSDTDDGGLRSKTWEELMQLNTRRNKH